MGSILSPALTRLGAALIVGMACMSPAANAQTGAVETSAAVGPADAPNVITVYSDFTSRPCGHLAVVLQTLVMAAPQRVRIVFKHAPPEDGRGRAAHLAAAAAARQGRFWDMHNVLFANQDRQSMADVVGMAQQIGLDMELFRTALGSAEVAASVDADAAESRLGPPNRPYILINGVPYTAEPTLNGLSAALTPQ